MTEVIIVEDERLAADKLSRQLRNIDPEIEIVATLDTVAKAVDFLASRSVDLIFLDVHLGDDISFSIFDQVKVKTPIIFTTAYDQYAIKAFKLNSLDYLLKPVSKNELQTALTKYFEQKPVSPVPDYQSLLASLKSNDTSIYQTRFIVYKGDKVKTIEVSEIAYFFAEGKYVYLVDKGSVEYLVDYTLDKLNGCLDPMRFFRINRQLIIQVCAIEEMTSYSKGRLKINLNPPSRKEAIVSIERATAFKNWLNR